jgi:antitoxin CptB
MSTQDAAALNQLRWRCRRGMRELDVLLERYLDTRWASASEGRRQEFRALLELADPELAALCLGTVAPSAEQVALLRELRETPRELSAATVVYPSIVGPAPRPEQDL